METPLVTDPFASADVLGVELDDAIDRFEKEADELTPAELAAAVERIARLRSRVEAIELAVIGRYDRSMEWSADGHRHPTSAVKSICRVPRGVAGKRVQLARKLQLMPHTQGAFADGAIELCHVERLAKANSPARAEAFAEIEATLVDVATRCSFADFVKAVEYFESFNDPDPDPGDDSRRSCYSSKLLDGTGKVDATLDPVGHAIFDKVLRQIEQELFDADWAAAVALHGPNPTNEQLGRTPAQRRADALIEMARRAAAMPDAARRPDPSVIVHIDHQTLEAELKRRVGAPYEFPQQRTCELQDGTVISPAQAAGLAIEGHIRRMVFDTDGIATTFGRTKRLFTGGLRDFIEARDRTCRADNCDTPHYLCDVDHIIDWQHAGATDHDNGQLLCPTHNHTKHRYDITTCPATGRTRWRLRP